MKIHALTIAAIMALGFSAANAADQGSGKITFTGSIIDAPCSIAPGSVNQEVPLGAISNVALQANNGTGVSTPVPFSIELQNCVITTPDKVTVTFTGAESTYNPDSLGLIGDAEGAFIQLKTVDGADVKLNQATAPRTLITANSQTLDFTAQLKGGGDPLAILPGSFQTPATFVLAYQ